MTKRAYVLPIAIFVLVHLLGLIPGHSGAQTDSEGSSQIEELDFEIGVGDVLGISVWNEENLRVVIPVRPDGRIAVPLLGEVEVLGRTPNEVREELARGYEQYVTAPAVSVVVTEINSRKIYILGEVASAGVYDMLEPITVLQALARAGGFTDFAKKDEVVVLRREVGTETRLVVSIKGVTSGRDLGGNILLRPGDTVYVP